MQAEREREREREREVQAEAGGAAKSGLHAQARFMINDQPVNYSYRPVKLVHRLVVDQCHGGQILRSAEQLEVTERTHLWDTGEAPGGTCCSMHNTRRRKGSGVEGQSHSKVV